MRRFSSSPATPRRWPRHRAASPSATDCRGRARAGATRSRGPRRRDARSRSTGSSVSVAGVVVTHGPDAELERCLEALAPGGRARRRREPARARRCDARRSSTRRRAGFAANANRGIAATTAPFVARRKSRHGARAGRRRALLRDFAEVHPRCGIAGPQMLFPDGTLAALAAQLPDGLRDDRPAHAARRSSAAERQLDHYLSRSGRSPCRPTGCSAAFLLLRREMLDELGGFDEGFRLYGEDIDLCYRAAQAGWERWYVPHGRRPARPCGGHRPAIPDAADALALARDHALCAQAPRRLRNI